MNFSVPESPVRYYAIGIMKKIPICDLRLLANSKNCRLTIPKDIVPTVGASSSTLQGGFKIKLLYFQFKCFFNFFAFAENFEFNFIANVHIEDESPEISIAAYLFSVY